MVRVGGSGPCDHEYLVCDLIEHRVAPVKAEDAGCMRLLDKGKSVAVVVENVRCVSCGKKMLDGQYNVVGLDLVL